MTKKTKINLDELSRDQKLRLFDLIEEKKRRARDKKANYKPNPGQKPVHESQKPERWVFSGNGAGKSALAANEAKWALEGYHPIWETFTKTPCRVIVVLDHPEKATDQWVPELGKWMNLTPEMLQKRGRAHVSAIQHRTGSELLFMTHQQDPLLFESIEADVIIFDEPPPRHVYVGLKRGLRQRHSKPWILGVGTPITGTWMRTEILVPWQKGDRDNTDCFRFGTAVNKANLEEGYIEEFASVLTEKEKRIRLEGEFFDLEGLALAPIFKRETHVVPGFEWRETDPVVVAIDPHSAKPHHACMLGVDRDNYLYYLKEFSSRGVARRFAQQLKEFMAGYRVVDIVSDSLGKSPYTSGEGEKSFIEVLNDEGVRVRSTTWSDKSDEDFIDRIKTALSRPETDNFGNEVPRLRIFEGNEGIVGDIENVCWVKHKALDEYKPKLDIQNKDWLACLKYALACNLVFGRDKSKPYRAKKSPSSYGISRGYGRSFYRKKLNVKTRK